MKKVITMFVAVVFLLPATCLFGQQPRSPLQGSSKPFEQADTRIDNNKYWKTMAAQGQATLNPVYPVPAAKFTGSEIRAFSSITEDSPDVPVAPNSSTQSENSIFVNPNDETNVLSSHNSSANPMTTFYGTSYLYTHDGGLTFEGSVQGAGGSNSGDPVALIGNNGNYFIGFINNNYGQGIAISTNQGVNWTPYVVANAGGGGLLDKNHMWIDNNLSSPYEGNLYDAWTDFGGSFDSDIGFNYSTDGGLTWSTPINVSQAVNSGSHDQGVNISTGPNGEVYVIWAIYDGWPTNETSIGMARSLDGGATFPPATRIISNINGIRNFDIGKNMRHNSFPSMAVDQQSGAIYIVWANAGVPGINTGNDVDVYMIRSTDGGTTWSDPIRVNQDASGLGRVHYFPWITSDPDNGALSVIFYDDRNVGGAQCEVYCANSFDGGDTWEDFKVSDVAFTPTPIAGLADGYMGDYIGINAKGGYVYPVWADTRTGSVMSYVSPYQTNPLSRPTNLSGIVTFETGIASLTWTYEFQEGFEYFNVYRDDVLVGTATDTTYEDQLPDYGIYEYSVTAFYTLDGESSSTRTTLQWGDAQITYDPLSITEYIQPDSSKTVYVNLYNVGQLPMNYDISTFITTDGGRDAKAYCTGGGGCDEYILRVQFGSIDNVSGCTQYGNYSALTTTISVGNVYPITVTNGNPIYPADYLSIWIDWNQDEVFQDTESVPVTGSPGVGPYTADVIPPLGAKSGTTRMRVRMTWNEVPVPCGYTTYGEVEDYSVYVISWLAIEPAEGNIEPGGSAQLAVTLDATGLAVGTYTADLMIYSNDPDDPEVVIPVTLIVSELAANISATDEMICMGEEVQLTAEAFGGSGTYTYSWTSDPEGFTSTDPVITVAPDETTTYIVEVSDGLLFATDQLTVSVYPYPEINLGEDQFACIGDTITLDAGLHTAYLWSTGDTTAVVKVFETGDYWVLVSNEADCSTADTVNIIVAQIPGTTAITGPAVVDNYMTATSIYEASPSVDATSYVWSIVPTEAGATTSTGASAEFTWNAGYTGNAEITVYGLNDCGQGELSAAYAIQIFSSQGIGDLSNPVFQVYPNPNDGKFTLKFNNASEMRAEIRLVNVKGERVYQKTDVVIAPLGQLDLDPGNIAKGYYTLQVIGMNGKLEAPVVVIK